MKITAIYIYNGCILTQTTVYTELMFHDVLVKYKHKTIKEAPRFSKQKIIRLKKLQRYLAKLEESDG